MNDYMIAVILGIVEGFTEYLPVSSTGHMILVGDWLGFDGPRASVFEVFIQLGAILSVLIIYKEKFIRMLYQYRCWNLFRREWVSAIWPIMPSKPISFQQVQLLSV